MRDLPKVVTKALQTEWVRIALAGMGLTLLVVHGAAPGSFKIDTTTLGLLLFLLVVLLLPQISEFTFFGNTVKFRQRVENAATLADQVDASTRRIAPDSEPAESIDSHPADDIAAVDPVGSVTGDRARVAQAILDLYKIVYAEDPKALGLAIARLEHDGYLAEGLTSLARSLLNLTQGAVKYDSLTVDQARQIRDSTNKFFLSLGRVSSLSFERWVEDALRGLGGEGIDVEHRPASPQRRGRYTVAPDFVLTTERGTIVVEAYLPEGQAVPRRVTRRVDDRLQRFVIPTRAAGLIVVLPDGVPRTILDMDVPPNVVLLTLSELRERVREGTLLRDSRLLG